MVLREERVDRDESVGITLASDRGAEDRVVPVGPTAITYNFVVAPLLVVPRISTWIHVPDGVSAFQDETNSVNDKFGL
jgi:hypothetical protein